MAEWPETLQQEITALDWGNAPLLLPEGLVEQSLKKGRLALTWKVLRTLLKTSCPFSSSPHDNLVLNLPLKEIVPLFLARRQGHVTGQRKAIVDAAIPNLFYGAPKAETAAPAAPAPDTNFFSRPETPGSTAPDAAESRPAASPGTRFVAKYATPNEIVSRAASLQGVAGALIALPDGLMVANRLPSDYNPDTLAAFLPQIFGKLSGCTQELRMGEVNNLSFTVGAVPWKIFRVHAIFFAALGRAGEPLPGAALAALAAELDHKTK